MTQIITSNSGGGGGAGAYTYKGTVNTYEDLPSTGLKIGDVYNVINEHTTDPKFPAGANVAWTGTEWDVLGGTIDLSIYQKKLVEGNGIDIDQDTNEISVEDTVINGAAAGATAIQPNDNVSELVNDAGYLVSSDLKQSDWGQSNSSEIDYIKNKPTIGNATLTIQKNGTTVNSITMNSTSNVTANISVPTDTSDLTNGAGFITNSALSGYQTTANLVTDLTNPDNTHYPSAKAVSDALSGAGAGDMLKSVYDPNNVAANAFDYDNFINTPTIPSVIDALNSTSTTDALSAKQGKVLKDSVDEINGKIPSAATTSNQLADKDFVNSSINSVAAYYITKNAQGDQFATYLELSNATTFYSGGVVRVPTRNDYCIVQADENHDNATTRYIYNNGWEFQYVVNETALTSAQLNALNSGITSGKVSTYDGYATSKQDALVSGTNIKTINGSSILGNGNIDTPNTTYNDATQSTAGLMSASDKTKLDGIDSGAQVNSITGVKGDAESTFRTGNVNITPANIGITNKAAASGGNDDSLVTTGDKYNWNNKVDGPSSATNNHLAVFDGTTGKLIKDGGAVPTGVPSGGNNGDVLTNVNGTPTWQAPSGGISLDANSPITVSKLWVGTEAQYSALGSYSNDTVYMTV